ncbi:hypothetical protein BJX96DRAFT_148740 [Aspergillus floccosus]
MIGGGWAAGIIERVGHRWYLLFCFIRLVLGLWYLVGYKNLQGSHKDRKVLKYLG